MNSGGVHSWWIRIAALAIWSAPVVAQDVGFEGPSFPSSVTTPTESKPESKLWFHDGSWWGSLWSSAGSAYRIHRLDFFTHDWVDTGVAIETRANSHSDALWDGTKLYIASHRFSTTGSSTGNPIRLSRYGYDTATDRYSLDEGFPVTIGDVSTEALVIDKDSTGTVWAAWTQSRRVRICHTVGSDTQWSTPVVLPRNTTNIDADDICSLIHFGNRIGVLWSDQVENAYRFSFHVDGAPDTTWSAVENVTNNETDDHLHLAADSTGRVFLAGKNLANNLLLLVRASNGGWSRFVITNPTPILTRPIVLLNEETRRIHVFATGQDSGEVFEKTSSLDSISFGSGTGTIRMRDASTPFRISDPTSTKQNLTTASGLVVLAHHDTTGSYWHHEVVPPPTTDFLAAPTGGVSPLAVAFTDRSTGPIGTRTWSFGDGGTSSATNPSHTYGPGTFTVSLTATGPGGTDTETKTGYIVVVPPPPVADFEAAPTSGFAPLSVAFTDASTGSITSRLWSFGDGGTSSATNPSHTYAAGIYTVSLTATGPGGADTETKTSLVVVVSPPPVANFSAAPTSGFAPLAVAFTDSSTGPITTRLWSFGDGGTSSATNPSHTYAAGIYTVSLELTGPGGSDTETKTSFIVVTLPPPVASFGAAPTSGLAPLDVAFTDTSTGSIASRLWSFGDGATSSLPNPVHTYAAGTFTVSLTVTGPGGTDTETRTNLITVGTPAGPPVAGFTAAPTSGEAPLGVAFTDASAGSITSRLWSFGDGGTSSATNPSHTYAAGTYTVSLTVTGPGGADTETRTNLITAEPTGPTLALVATVETAPVPSQGDSADDVAVWVHPLDRTLSTILGTDKNSGLAVYDLAGNQLQFLPDGRLNNVDLRYAFPLGGTEVALVTAGERDTNLIRIYAIDQATRRVSDVAARPITPGLDVHGSCMYRSALTGETYFFGTSKDGGVEQWRLFDAGNGRVDAQRVRSFTVGGQVEGCVADDEAGFFFVSEEDVGIWRYGAEPGAGAVRVRVDTTGAGGHLTPDVEGLAIYTAGGGAGYLLASSQGDSSFAVYERRPPHAFLTRFQIGANLGSGIDDVTGTDGIEVVNLGLGGAFPEGVFVVQDEANPGANQNFKLVPWPAIAAAANPPLLVDSSYDAHGTCVDATVQHRNGTGLNPLVLTNLRPARLGALWECELDCAGHAPGIGQVFGYGAPASGPVYLVGELLIDLSSTYYFTLSAIHLGNAIRFQALVPNDIALCGRTLSIQGLCKGAPGPRLSNAIDLRVGR